jgi:hypothetical protein
MAGLDRPSTSFDALNGQNRTREDSLTKAFANRSMIF